MENSRNNLGNYQVKEVTVSNIRSIKFFYNQFLGRNNGYALDESFGLPFTSLEKDGHCFGFASLIVDDKSNISYQIILAKEIDLGLKQYFENISKIKYDRSQSNLFKDAKHLESGIKRTVNWLNLNSTANINTSTYSIKQKKQYGEQGGIVLKGS